MVRQTVSKWETGLSVPDADLLIALAEALETPVSALLEETPPQDSGEGELQRLSERLENLNLQLAQRKDSTRRAWHIGCIALCAVIAAAFAALWLLRSPYLGWDFSDPETAVLGTAFHIFEWLFVRAAPLLFIGAAAGAVLTRRK